MAGIVDIENSHETIVTQFKSRDAAVGAGDPDGLEVRGVEGAHEVKGEDADGAGVAEDRDLAAAVLFDDVVELLAGAVQQLSITLAASQHVLEVATEQGSVLFRVLLSGGFKRQTFHHANAALAKGAGVLNRQARQV